jgi:hypothetical protein
MERDPQKLSILLDMARELYVDAGEPYGPVSDDDAVRRWVFDASARSQLVPELELRLLAMERRLERIERAVRADDIG